jgi:hypothetical protein
MILQLMFHFHPFSLGFCRGWWYFSPFLAHFTPGLPPSLRGSPMATEACLDSAQLCERRQWQ